MTGTMPRQNKKNECLPLTEQELEAVTVVFHQYETGLREGTIYPKDLLAAMKALGLSPSEQEIIDMHNEVEKKGFIYFPDFCKLCHRKFRELDEEHFRQELFKDEFRHMMTHLPVPVSEKDIEEMFSVADRDKDGRITYEEFQIMITPPQRPEYHHHRPVVVAQKPGAKPTDSPGMAAVSGGGQRGVLQRQETVTSLGKAEGAVGTTAPATSTATTTAASGTAASTSATATTTAAAAKTGSRWSKVVVAAQAAQTISANVGTSSAAAATTTSATPAVQTTAVIQSTATPATVATAVVTTVGDTGAAAAATKV